MKQKNISKPMQPVSIKPGEYAEHSILTAILEGDYTRGSVLPGERVLAEKLGVTRPTLRETLQRLSREGWVTIRHGKPSLVNDYLKDGGLRMLSTMTKYSEYLPDGFIQSLLEFRMTLLPVIAERAAAHAPERLLVYLDGRKSLEDDPAAFAEYDWELQTLMARLSKNPIYNMIINDFTEMYKTIAIRYFVSDQARTISKNYYRNLAGTVKKGEKSVEDVTRQMMQESIFIWDDIKQQHKEAKHAAMERMGR